MPLLVPPLLATLLSSPLTLAVLGSTPKPRVPQLGSQGSDGGLVVKPAAAEPTSYQNGGAMEPALAERESGAAVQNGGAMEPALAERESGAAVASMTNATSAHDQRNASVDAMDDGQLSRRLAFERLAPAERLTSAQEEHTRSWLETQQPSDSFSAAAATDAASPSNSSSAAAATDAAAPSNSSSAAATDAAAADTGWNLLRRGTDSDPSTPGSVFHRRARDQLSRERTHSWLHDQQPSSSAASSVYAASSTGASEPATPESLFRRRAREQLSRAFTADDVGCGSASPGRWGAAASAAAAGGSPASSVAGSAHSQPSAGAAGAKLVRRFSFASGEAAKVRAAKAWAEAAEAPPQPSTDAAVTGRLVRRFSFASGEAAKVRAAKARAAAEAASSPKLDNGRKLFAAVKRGQLPMVREALACAECDVNCHDHERNTPLHWAVKLDDAQSLTLLLTHAGRGHDLDVNRANARGETALHLAAGGGQHRLVRELWRQPALKPELRDKDGHTAHRLAVRGSHSELAKLLAAGRWGAPANRWGEVGASRRKLKGAVGAVVALQKAGGWNSEREEAPEGAAVAAARARAAVAARAAAAAAAAASATPESAAAVASAASASAQRAAAASAAMPPAAAAAAAAAAEAKAAAAAATAAAAAEAAAKAEAQAAAAVAAASVAIRRASASAAAAAAAAVVLPAAAMAAALPAPLELRRRRSSSSTSSSSEMGDSDLGRDAPQAAVDFMAAWTRAGSPPGSPQHSVPASPKCP